MNVKLKQSVHQHENYNSKAYIKKPLLDYMPSRLDEKKNALNRK